MSLAELAVLPLLIAALLAVTFSTRRRSRALREAATAQALLQSANRDRQRAAFNLHNATLQELSAARLSLQAALKEIPIGHPARPMLDVTSLAVGNALSDVLDAASDLYPEDISATRLRAALERLVAPLRRDGALVPITVHFDVTPSSDAMATIYRCARECLGDVQAASAASTVRIDIRGGEDEIRVRITHDTPDRPRVAGSSDEGGVALAERLAAAAGGSLRVAAPASPDGLLTTVIVLPARAAR